MTDPIPPFTEDEQRTVAEALHKRYREAVSLEEAEAEVQLNPDDEDLTECPVLYWAARGTHHIIFKLGEQRFRGQFFYSETQQFGTGRDDFDTLADCVTTLLQVQADHERQMAMLRTGLSAVDRLDGDYNGPSIS